MFIKREKISEEYERIRKGMKEQMKDTEEKIKKHEVLIAHLQKKLEKLLEANAYKDKLMDLENVVASIRNNETEMQMSQMKLDVLRFKLSQIE